MSSRKSLASKVLLPYQRRALRAFETYKYSILMWARQTGKSFVVALFAVLRAIEKRNHLVAIISPTERQSKELMEKVKRHVEFFRILGVEYGESFFEDTHTNVLEVRFPNGSRIVGLPANPEGVRGLTGDVVLEEAAFFKDGYRVYQAIFPSITRGKDYKLIVISTPRGKSDVFYHLWTMAEGMELWYREKLTIEDAVERGLEVDISSLRKGVPNEDIWRQEYLCEFMDENYVLLPYEVIQAVEDPQVSISNLNELTGNVYVGVDVARRGHLTVVSILEEIGSTVYLRKTEILKDMPFSEQFKVIDHITHFARRIAIDETGLGMQLAEDLAKKWGEIKVLRVYFTARAKEELASRLQARFMDRTIRIPPDRDLREDLHSVQKTLTPSGNVKIEGETEESHADRFWSLALAVYAASKEEQKIYIPPVWVNAKLGKELEYGLGRLAA
jgi:phage FluMu gp28-like protein